MKFFLFNLIFIVHTTSENLNFTLLAPVGDVNGGELREDGGKFFQQHKAPSFNICIYFFKAGQRGIFFFFF